MNPDEFFSIFLIELEQSPEFHRYYKFLGNRRSFLFRKNYFIKRLEFIKNNVGENSNNIWDVGCGYGTTAIFLALNGYEVHGSTLEFYYEQIQKRIEFWSQYGNLTKFSYSYENIFDVNIPRFQYDRIIAQDTLHHLEPIKPALALLSTALKQNGKLIVVEENGNNVFIRSHLFIQRGNKRIIEVFDEKLQKTVRIGNENIRSFEQWRCLFTEQKFLIERHEFIRFYLPFYWTNQNYRALQMKEDDMWKHHRLFREFGFFGVNFVASKM
jgi:2-polyprenyl-3-methyl-5-hydroxy-6-metoxy-1,4-benzoquinol methylase